MNETVQTELKKIFDGRFSTSESTRSNYARGEDTYDPVLSKAVVFPETNEEVSQLLKLYWNFFRRPCCWKSKRNNNFSRKNE